MGRCQIILADDHEIFRAGLKSLIDKENDLKIVDEAKDGEELLLKLKSRMCDLIVMDLSMPNLDGLTAMDVIRKRYPKIKILVLTMQKDNEHFKHAMQTGACGYILKDDAFEQLILAVKLIMKGKKFISPKISEVVTDRFIRSVDEEDTPSLEILTKREKQILQLIASGLPNKNIASKLKISNRTVEAHRANLSNKLGIKTIAGLVKYAISKGIT